MLELVFFTSNRTKTIHARYLCRDYEIKIVNFREKTYHANYTEPRTHDRTKLLKDSFSSALEQSKRAGMDNHPFIIEDTSVIIHALSKEHEFPGTDVKYWMQETKFEDIDFELCFNGNNRSVTVRSDLLLYIPKIGSFTFTSSTDGRIIEKPNAALETNTLYPWLDHKTFNKWFCPEKEIVCISELPIEIADKYDFRRDAFSAMLDKINRLGLTKRVTPDIYYPNRTKFYDESSCHIVLGLTCSGKSTIAEHLSQKFNFFHIEASDFMHLIYLETHGEKSEVKIGAFAKDILAVKPTEVAKRVLNFLEVYHWPNIIITGFRKKEEVQFIVDNLIAGSIKKVFIEAPEDVRRGRHIKRNRDTSGYTQEEFSKRDLRELEMGLDAIQRDESVLKLSNSSTIKKYHSTYEVKMKPKTFRIDSLKNTEKIEDLKLKDLIVIALYKSKNKGEQSEFLTTGDIWKIVNNTIALEKPKFINNVARLLNKNFDVFFEVKYDAKNKKKLYRLSNTGTGHARTIIERCNF
jgi:inosine/xanthosine triphosphate pyrophosphatase family protein/dephospho-CoA kinase